MRYCTNKIVDNNLKRCVPLANALLAGTNHRYEEMLNFEPCAKNAILAVITHPKYKLKFVKPEKQEMIAHMLTYS